MSEKPSPHDFTAPKDLDKLLAELTTAEMRERISNMVDKVSRNRLSPADTDDLVQKIILLAYNSIKEGKFKENSTLTTWVYAITSNQVNLHYRLINAAQKRNFKRGDLIAQESHSQGELDPETQMIDLESGPDADLESLKERFDQEIGKLPPIYREALILRRQRFGIKEIAKQLKINVNTATSRVRRARLMIMGEKSDEE